MATNMDVLVDDQQSSPTASVQCETDPTAVNRVLVYDDLTYTPLSVSTFDLNPRGRDECLNEDETSSAPNISSQHPMPTPATTGSNVQLTDAVSTFQRHWRAYQLGAVILTPSQLHTIQQGFSCVVCLDLMEEPVFALCCRSIIGCKTCVEQWQQTYEHCPNCRGNTAGNIFVVTGLSEAFSALRSLS